jgi:neutral ceramidase
MTKQIKITTTTMKNKILPKTLKDFRIFSIGSLILFSILCHGQESRSGDGSIHIGVAHTDITPEGPIRLTGYAGRAKKEATGVIHRLAAKAMAFGSDDEEQSIFITVDLVGIPARVTAELAARLSKKTGIDAAHVAICASHTHGGPEVGNLLNILQYREKSFSDSLLSHEQSLNISRYTENLINKLEVLAMDALKDRKPALLAWGQGQAAFAKNRRAKGGPVDPSLPILRVTSPEGKLRAVLVNYACHGTTLGADVNKIHGDWIGEAQKLIEANHPGAIALIAIGCGADANPNPRGTTENMVAHGKEIATNVEKLLKAQLQPLTAPPVAQIKWVELPFSHVPSVSELIQTSSENSVKGYYARLSLDRIARGYEIPKTLSYPVQTWTFGNTLAIINLAGEVVADYAVRLKNELGADKLWVNAYANDVPCYIASRRVIKEGGYEAETSMYWYDKPSPFVEEVEDIIVESVHTLLPPSYKTDRPTKNHPVLVAPEENGAIHLHAETARSMGPKIQYMPEWKAFGWFTEADKVEWDVQVPRKGAYEVYLDWSVSDAEAGKPFVLETANRKVNGKVGKTGSWFTYRQEKIGTIHLRDGNQKIVFRPASSSQKGALMDLREITLMPVR